MEFADIVPQSFMIFMVRIAGVLQATVLWIASYELSVSCSDTEGFPYKLYISMSHLEK